jgi:hypothetical protein
MRKQGKDYTVVQTSSDWIRFSRVVRNSEPVFLNVYEAQESIPRNEFRQPMKPGGPVR